MEMTFYSASAVAVLATILALTRVNAMHALLYLTVSLLAVSLVFYTLGAPFIAVLEIIIYAGAIMVLFIFVVMLLNLGARSIAAERALLAGKAWVGPWLLAMFLVVELVFGVLHGPARGAPGIVVSPEAVGAALYGRYAIGVELASMLLLGALIGAYHLGQHRLFRPEVTDGRDTDRPRADPGGGPVLARRGGAADAAQRGVRADVD